MFLVIKDISLNIGINTYVLGHLASWLYQYQRNSNFINFSDSWSQSVPEQSRRHSQEVWSCHRHCQDICKTAIVEVYWVKIFSHRWDTTNVYENRLYIPNITEVVHNRSRTEVCLYTFSRWCNYCTTLLD
jgi:hypothetical protein